MAALAILLRFAFANRLMLLLVGEGHRAAWHVRVPRFGGVFDIECAHGQTKWNVEMITVNRYTSYFKPDDDKIPNGNLGW